MSGASELEKAIKRLAGKEQGWERFLPKPTVGGRDGATAVGRPASTTSGASSLIESDFTLREYWPDQTIYSTDGFFSFTVSPIHRIALEGGGFAEFQEPV